MAYDYLIVGAGFTGAVCARQLADAGKRVLIIDKRDHIGGNAYDYEERGVRIHKYGPHIFHTNSDTVFNWLSQFTEWRPYEHRVLAVVDGKTVPFPINIDTLNQFLGVEFDEADMRDFIEAAVHTSWDKTKLIVTAEDQCLATVGRDLYETFFKGYTTKMWGITPDKLDKSVTARIPLRFNHDDRYFTDKHQAMPKEGYTALFERMLDHPRITVELGAKVLRPVFTIGHVIWTGPIDEYFLDQSDKDGKPVFGPLPYRSLKFQHSAWETYPPVYQMPTTTINFPGERMGTRITEWARLQGEPAAVSTLTCEYPIDEGEPFYPVPSAESKALYKRYQALADNEPNVTFLGRLGTYSYLNMDQAVGQALAASSRLLSVTPLTV